MRHGKKFNHLGRTAPHRKAMLSNMAASLIVHKRISTTLAKAKELRKFIEPLVTRAKNSLSKEKMAATHDRRIVFSYLQNKVASRELFDEIAVKVGDRQGGYTRIIKTGTRLGDNAEMCIIELVDYNENLLKQSGDSKKTRRSRRRRKGGSGTSENEDVTTTTVAEDTTEISSTEDTTSGSDDTE